MVRIRLARVGAKKQPAYRIVVADKEAPRDGAFVEVIGQYNPRTEPELIRINEARALHWLKVGAQPSDAVLQLFRKSGTLARFERLKKGEPLEALLAEVPSGISGVEPPTLRTRVGRAVPAGAQPQQSAA